MEINQQPALEYAIDLWKDWMKSDFTELRPLWYPSESKGLVGGWSRSEGAFDDLAEEVESRIVIVVNTAVANMTPTMRAAFEASIGLLKVCKVRNAEEMAMEARSRVWRALLAEGAA